MNRKLLLGKGDDINKLASKLSRSDKVNSFDDDDKECGILAHSLSDLEGAFSAFLDIHLPKLMAENIDNTMDWNTDQKRERTKGY